MDCSANSPNIAITEGNHRQTAADTRKGILIKTFGCQMNEYDSEKMLVLLSETYRPVGTAEEADLILINTCSVRQKAESKLFSLLGTLREYKQQNPRLIIGVGGCVAQQEGRKIVEKNPHVDFVVGTHNLSLVPSLVAQAENGRTHQVVVNYREEWEELPDQFNIFPDIASEDISDDVYLQRMQASRVRALVAIQRGCNKNCSFCVVPNTRGPQVSRSLKEIEKEVRLKVSLGAREILLLGQTVNSYGLDLRPRVRFEDLVHHLAGIEGLMRIRFTSPHPADVRPGFIALFGTVAQLCPHIHLPLQSGSDRILKLMRRNYRRDRYLEIVSNLREQCPEIAISSDIIVGFPTETEEDFEKTLEVMSSVRYNSSFSFKYSRRPNTLAVDQFRPEEEIPEEIAQKRLLRLQELQDRISQEINISKVGSVVEVLVEGPNKKISSARGRIPHNTLVELIGGNPSPGEIVRAQIEHGSPHGLRGRILPQENN